MAPPALDLTQVLVTLISVIGSYFMGRRHGKKCPCPTCGNRRRQ